VNRCSPMGIPDPYPLMPEALHFRTHKDEALTSRSSRRLMNCFVSASDMTGRVRNQLADSFGDSNDMVGGPNPWRAILWCLLANSRSNSSVFLYSAATARSWAMCSFTGVDGSRYSFGNFSK